MLVVPPPADLRILLFSYESQNPESLEIVRKGRRSAALEMMDVEGPVHFRSGL